MPVRKGRCLKCKQKIATGSSVFNLKSILIVMVILFCCYFLSLPYLTSSQLGEGIRLRDSEAIDEVIDFVSVRQNIKDQLNSMMMRRLEADKALKDSPFSGFAMTLASAMVEKTIDVVMTPVGLANLMKQGDLKRNEEADYSVPANPIDDARLEYESLDKFSIWVKNDKGSDTRMIMRREGMTWKVVKIILPMDELEFETP